MYSVDGVAEMPTIDIRPPLFTPVAKSTSIAFALPSGEIAAFSVTTPLALPVSYTHLTLPTKA